MNDLSMFGKVKLCYSLSVDGIVDVRMVHKIYKLFSRKAGSGDWIEEYYYTALL